jgi:UDP-3-O-[3-hydroxymyristoyl] glucosamine N-acyltransferase
MTSGVDRSALAGDPRFFLRAGPQTLAAVVDAAEAEAPPRRLMLHRIAPLATATHEDITFCLNIRKNLPALRQTKAAAVIVHPDMKDQVPQTAVPIVTTDPAVAWAKVAALFHPLPPMTPGIHPSAVVAASARIDPTTEVGPLVVIGENVTIGPRGRIGALVSISDGVEIGRDVRIGPHVSVSHALIGNRVYLYPGVRIGQEGFGFAITPEGFQSVPQLGCVRIEDDVEVGANTTIGRACVIVAQVGISGSTVLEDQVVLAGQVGVAGHLRIGTGARVGAQSGIMADVPPRSELVGTPTQPVKSAFKEIATIRRWVRNGGIPVPRPARGTKSNPDTD